MGDYNFILYFVFNAQADGSMLQTPFVKAVYNAAYEAWNMRGYTSEGFPYNYITPSEAAKIGNYSEVLPDSVLVYSKIPINGSNYLLLRGVGTAQEWYTAFYNLFYLMAKAGQSKESNIILDTKGHGKGSDGSGSGTGSGNGNGLGGGLPKWLWLVVGGVTGLQAVSSDNTTKQILFGGVSGYCFYNYLKT